MNLIELALAAEAHFQQQSTIQQTTSQCVRTKNKYATCDRCVALCPTGAIHLDSGLPELTAEQCIKCGVCLHACPVGVFERPDSFQKLLLNTQSLPDHQVVDVACVHHSAPQTTAPAVDAVVQTKNCLADLGVSAFVGLLAVGAEQVRVRLDACATCPLRVLQPNIEQCIVETQQLLSVLGLSDAIVPVYDAQSDWVERPLHHNDNPPMSRRGLFSSLLNPEAALQQRAINAIDEGDPSEQLPRERRRLLTVLRMLTKPYADIPDEVGLFGDGFVQLVASDACNACGLCERVCPTDAIQVAKDDDQFMVIFEPHRCIDCQLCIDYCETHALETYGAPSLRDVLDETRLKLHAGEMQQCKRCKAHFAGSSDETLCPVCRSRRENPTSVNLPDAVLAKLSPAIREKLLGNVDSSPHEGGHFPVDSPN